MGDAKAAGLTLDEIRHVLNLKSRGQSSCNHVVAMVAQRLEELSGVSRDEAKQFLNENLVEQVKMESAQMLKDIRDTAKLEARKEAQKVIGE